MVMMVKCVVMSVSVCRRWRGLITAGLSRPSCSVNVHFSLNFGQSGNWVTHPATLPAHDRLKEISTLGVCVRVVVLESVELIHQNPKKPLISHLWGHHLMLILTNNSL